MNRKLIRPKLTEVTIRSNEEPRAGNSPSKLPSKNNGHGHQAKAPSNAGKASNQPVMKKSPPQDTNAEIFYYKKQIEGHVPMVIILQDGEKLFGTIEWYDRHALKVNRETEPNILLLKHNIKYMYKDPEKN